MNRVRKVRYPRESLGSAEHEMLDVKDLIAVFAKIVESARPAFGARRIVERTPARIGAGSVRRGQFVFRLFKLSRFRPVFFAKLVENSVDQSRFARGFDSRRKTFVGNELRLRRVLKEPVAPQSAFRIRDSRRILRDDVVGRFRKDAKLRDLRIEMDFLRKSLSMASELIAFVDANEQIARRRAFPQNADGIAGVYGQEFRSLR